MAFYFLEKSPKPLITVLVPHRDSCYCLCVCVRALPIYYLHTHTHTHVCVCVCVRTLPIYYLHTHTHVCVHCALCVLCLDGWSPPDLRPCTGHTWRLVHSTTIATHTLPWLLLYYTYYCTLASTLLLLLHYSDPYSNSTVLLLCQLHSMLQVRPWERRRQEWKIISQQIASHNLGNNLNWLLTGKTLV